MSDAPISPEAIARVDVALAAARPAPADDFPCCSPGSTAHEPKLLPFCDCGSVDKYGDDLGEHGPRCPYHLAVLRISPAITARELDDLCVRTLRAMAAAS